MQWAEALKQFSSHLPFVELKTKMKVPILRVLWKMLQFRTAGHPCCHLHPCTAAEHGKVRGSGEIRCVAALTEHLEEMGSVCVGSDVFMYLSLS